MKADCRLRLEELESRVLPSIYYLAPSGSDANPGTIEAPWATLHAASTKVAAGDGLQLRQGTYQGFVTFYVPSLTIESYPGEKAKITAPFNDANIGWVLRFHIEASYGTLRNLDLEGGGYYVVKTESNFDYGVPEDQKHGASHLTVEDSKLHDSGRDVIKLVPYVDDVTIRRNEIYNSGRRDPSNAEGIDAVNSDRLLIQDNYIHDIATTGIYSKGGGIGTVIERNRVENCINGGGILLGFCTDAEFFDPSNTDYWESLDGTVRNNIVIGTAYNGIGVFSALRPLVVNNTLIDVAQVGRSGLGVDCGNYLPPDWTTVRPSKDVWFANNIVSVSTAANRPVFDIRVDGLESGLYLRSNRYYAGVNVPTFKDVRTGFSGDLAAWQVYTGVDVNSSVGDPLLAADGHLRADSPCINAGIWLPRVLVDVDGQDRAGRRDIGADEWHAGTSPMASLATDLYFLRKARESA